LVPNKHVRPTTDFVREALYNIIGNDIKDSNILDLFGGSGALSIEGISRGANFATIIDKNSMAIKIIKNNLKNIDIQNAKVIKGDSRAIIKTLSQNNENKSKFNIVFLDPPYKEIFIYKEILKLLYKSNLLSENAYIICELNSKENLENIENYQEIKNKKYGNSRLIFLKLI
jgi:16S rRNA (guanine(966)-N(2))-methyltransferase RsmD